MAKDQPDHHDAELAIKVYDLRREAVMRESRNAINRQFWPATYSDVQAILRSDHPLNAAYRQVGTFWEMVYGIARHGIVHGEYWAESNGEGLLLFAKMHPFLTELRRDTNQTTFRNAEWIATETAEGRRIFDMMRARVKVVVESRP